MRRFWSILIAFLCSILAMTAASYVGMLFLMLFDPNYHNGYSLLGGLVIGVIVAVLVFRAVIKRINLSNTPRDSYGC
jgi:prolipoprotein diacylglyceryltransferase